MWCRTPAASSRATTAPACTPPSTSVAGTPTVAGTPNPAATPTTTPTASGSATHHYLYVFPEGGMYVYDMDNTFSLVKTVSLPQTSHGTRDVVASPTTHMLYISI